METVVNEYIIRPANAVDLDQVFQMLVDLAKLEGSFAYFKLTRERLEEELFRANADWHCLVGSNPHQALLGFCLYTYANINRAFNLTSMIQVDHLYVKPEFRNLKIGYNLIHHLALIAKNQNISRLNVWCMKDNVRAQNFYQKIGAEKRDFIDVFSIQTADILANG